MTVRSIAYETEFLKHAAQDAAKRYGVGDGDGFISQILTRLENGERLYGTRFMDRDGCRDIMEEAQDIGAYGVLEAQKRIALGDEDEHVAWYLYQAVVHAAASEWFARQARIHTDAR